MKLLIDIYYIDPFYIKLPEKYLLPGLHVSGILHPSRSIFPGHNMSFSPHFIGQALKQSPTLFGMQKSAVICVPVLGSHSPGHMFSFSQSHLTGTFWARETKAKDDKSIKQALMLDKIKT